MNKINFVLCYDNNVDKAARKLILDLCYLHKKCDIWVISYSFDKEYIDELNGMIKEYSECNIIGYFVNKNVLSNYKTADYISDITNYRYYMFLLPIDKYIYLDIDIQVMKPLYDLFDLEISPKTVAAIVDYPKTRFDRKIAFSTGVMLINQPKTNEAKLKIFNELCNTHASHPDNTNADQNVFNLVFESDVAYLNKIFELDIAEDIRRSEIELDDEAVSKYYIIHYKGFLKPYHTYMFVRYIKYYRYLKDGKFFDFEVNL